eukprot:872624-Prorocentrum_minimum.AAC.3
MIAQINRNGDAVFRNAEVTMFLEGGGEHRRRAGNRARCAPYQLSIDSGDAGSLAECSRAAQLVVLRASSWQHDERTCGGRDPSTGLGHPGTKSRRPHVGDARCARRAEVERDGLLVVEEPRSLGSGHPGTKSGRPHVGDARCAGRAEVGRDGPFVVEEPRPLGSGHPGTKSLCGARRGGTRWTLWRTSPRRYTRRRFWRATIAGGRT